MSGVGRSQLTSLLGADSISKSFRGRQVLDAVSLSVGEGEVIAIIGPSGSGKSTLLHCLSGITRPDDGAVRFRGTTLSELGEAERARLRRSEFGVLFQFGQLIPELTAAENVALPLLLDGTRRRAALERATATLARFSVEELKMARISELSGGQAQRVALARAVVTDPAVVFADEPTGALDSVAGGQVLEELLGLARGGTAVVLVTQDLRVASRADRVEELSDGRLARP